MGDGALKVTDWVQAGRYAAGLDPLTAAGGPTSEVVGVSSFLKYSTTAAHSSRASASKRVVRVSEAFAIQGLTAVVTANLVAQGDENALGFSLTFNPAAFRFAGVSLGSAATGVSLNVNSNLVSAGKLGLLLALPTGENFPAGFLELVKVSLAVGNSVTGIFPVMFSDQPVPRGLSDPSANELSASYAAGTIVVNPPPSLSIMRDGDNVTLSWPTWAVAFQLQSLDTSILPSVSWTNLGVSAQTNGMGLSISMPISGQMQLYRLSAP